jgi:hypothetical protein
MDQMRPEEKANKYEGRPDLAGPLIKGRVQIARYLEQDNDEGDDGNDTLDPEHVKEGIQRNSAEASNARRQ